MKLGESDTLTLPPGTVVLKYEESKIKELLIDYPVMSSPATFVYHHVWGLGQYLDNDEEHISYKFKEKKCTLKG